ncbi:hypothetical protein [Chrysochromulina parva virophage Larry]|nr:hypothetical protein [Chrysochromulina parva virophage Larry]
MAEDIPTGGWPVRDPFVPKMEETKDIRDARSREMRAMMATPHGREMIETRARQTRAMMATPRGREEAAAREAAAAAEEERGAEAAREGQRRVEDYFREQRAQQLRAEQQRVEQRAEQRMLMRQLPYVEAALGAGPSTSNSDAPRPSPEQPARRTGIIPYLSNILNIRQRPRRRNVRPNDDLTGLD